MSDSSMAESSNASKKPVETTITPPKSNSSTTEPSTASEKRVQIDLISLKEPNSSTAELSTTTKKPIGTTIKAEPDSSAADPPILSNTSATTNGPSAAYCFPGRHHRISEISDPNIMNNLITYAIFQLTIQSIEKELSNRNGDIFLCSPYAKYEALTLLFFGSRGDHTEWYMRDKLSISVFFSKIDVLRRYNNSRKIDQERKKKGDESGNYKYNFATHLWIDKRYKLRECMLDLLGNKIENIDFRDRPTDLMNDLIKNETEDRMYVSSTDADLDDSNFLLVTYIYFDGRWATPFETINITTHPFHGSAITYTTFMDFTGNFNYVESEQLGVQILQLPYEGAEISMFMLLPLKFNLKSRFNLMVSSLRDLKNRLKPGWGDKSSELKKYLKGIPSVAKCQVSLPRFQTSSLSQYEWVRSKNDFRDFYDGDEDTGGLVNVYTILKVYRESSEETYCKSHTEYFETCKIHCKPPVPVYNL